MICRLPCQPNWLNTGRGYMRHPVRQLIDWADGHTGDIDAARAQHDARPALSFG